MYEAFYSLRARPFGSHVGGGDTWLAPDVDQSLQHAVASLENGSEIVLMSGPRGSGRTTLSRELGRRLAPRFQTVFLGHCEFASPLEMWRTILFELGQEFASLSADDARLCVTSAAREVRADRDGLVVIADDADSLGDGHLDEFRRLLVQIHEGRPLVQLVLCGTYALEERLANPELQQAAERIGRHIVLESLTRDQSRNYIQHRLESVGGQLPDVFSDAALQSIAAACDGNLQCLNQLCDHTLLLGFANEERPVTEATVAAALEDLKSLSLPWNIPSISQHDAPAPAGDPDSAQETPSSGEGEPPLTDAEETHAEVSVGDDTRVAASGPDVSRMWWDNEGDAAAIEVGAEQSSEPDAACTEDARMSTASDDSSSMNAASSESRDLSDPDVQESAVIDPYAALDRLAELGVSGGTELPNIPTGTTFVCEAPAGDDSAASGDDPDNQDGEPPRTSNGIETRLLLDVTALRNELKAESEIEHRVEAAAVREIAPTDPAWDVVEPAADEPSAEDAAPVAEIEDAFKPTEPMIEVDDLDPADARSGACGEGGEHRRYARLFTRLKERRSDMESESGPQSLRLWR